MRSKGELYFTPVLVTCGLTCHFQGYTDHGSRKCHIQQYRPHWISQPNLHLRRVTEENCHPTILILGYEHVRCINICDNWRNCWSTRSRASFNLHNGGRIIRIRTHIGSNINLELGIGSCMVPSRNNTTTNTSKLHCVHDNWNFRQQLHKYCRDYFAKRRRL